MNIDQCLASIKTWLLEQNADHHAEIDPDLDLVESGLLDSLKVMTLVVLIEKLRNQPIALEQMSIERLKTLTLIRQNFLQSA
jgi:acyl carrier protein